MLEQPLASQVVLTWMNVLIALVWIFCAATAFGAWRTFRQVADLRWLGAYALMTLFSLGRAFSAWQWTDAEARGILDQSFTGMVADAGWFEVQIAMLHLAGALVVLFAFRTRRVDFD